MNDDFSDHPKTIGEIRSDKSQRARDWSVKDALISALREIDKGELPANVCVLVFGKIGDDGSSETWLKVAGSPNMYVTLGMLDRAKTLVNDG